jgi:carboxyl-terminal processing protease
MRKIFYLVILLAVVVSSCKKSKTPAPDDTPIGPSKTGTTLDLIRDSIYLFAKEAYYWNDGLPSYATFKPRTFTGTDDISALQKEVDALSQYKINPNTGKPYEYYPASPGEAKYSFIDDGTVSSELNGVNGDFGFAPIYAAVNDLRVRYVYPNSPADLAGLKRGYQITSINGRTNLAYDGNGGAGTNLNFVINAYANSSTITMVLKKPDNTSITATLTAATYTTNPVITHKVFDQGTGKKVGYIVFNSFTSMANAQPKLDEAFNDFNAQSITDLVVDLRYNGGGFVNTAEYLSNLIVPAAKSGTTMYTAFYNTDLQANKYPLLSTMYNISPGDFLPANNQVKFSKKGSLNISRVFFIVTGSTASASELTINNLIPEMDVKLIGTTSYGKPVGFFGIDINKYQLYVPEFETKNSATKGGYYAGMTPGSTDYPGLEHIDDVTKDFGDPTELLLAYALNYVKTGTFTVAGQVIQSTAGKANVMSVDQSREAGIEMDGNKFRGMVFNKSLKKK